MKKALTNRKESHITMMLISNPDEDIRSFRISKTFVKSIALFTVLLLTYSVVVSTDYLNLNRRQDIALARIQYLKDDNRKQEVEIASLYNYSDRVKGKMEALIEFDGEVRGMVGLNGESDKRLKEFQQQLYEKSEGVLVASRGRRVPGLSELERLGLVGVKAAPDIAKGPTSNLDDSTQALSCQMDIQQEEMDKLLSEVDARLKYLEARPTFLPVSGTITSRFGSRKHPFTKKYNFHGAVDIAVKSGTPIRATGDGVVTFSGTNGGYGRMVEINHGYGIKTRYAHNSSNAVKKGDKVSKGQIIARVGSTGISTGPHVHFEVEVKGELVDPIKFVNSKD